MKKTWIILFLLLSIVSCAKNKSGGSDSGVTVDPYTLGESAITSEHTTPIRLYSNRFQYNSTFRVIRRSSTGHTSIDCRISGRYGQMTEFNLMDSELEVWENGYRYVYNKISGPSNSILGIWVNNRVEGHQTEIKTLNFMDYNTLKISRSCI